MIYIKENNIPLTNIMACATDAAASMVGRYRGFIAYLNNDVPKVFLRTLHDPSSTFGCKKMERYQHNVFAIVTKAVNLVKSNVLQDRLFRKLCEENEE